MSFVAAAAITSALIGAASAEYQRQKREEAREEAKEEREKKQEQREEKRANRKAVMGKTDLKADSRKARASSTGTSSLRIPSGAGSAGGLNA